MDTSEVSVNLDKDDIVREHPSKVQIGLHLPCPGERVGDDKIAPVRHGLPRHVLAVLYGSWGISRTPSVPAALDKELILFQVQASEGTGVGGFSGSGESANKGKGSHAEYSTNPRPKSTCRTRSTVQRSRRGARAVRRSVQDAMKAMASS